MQFFSKINDMTVSKSQIPRDEKKKDIAMMRNTRAQRKKHTIR
jgi:hypothetical protein